MPYEVQTTVFEGPFDVLLRLILEQEVDIYEVSLTSIVDAYLAEMDRIIGTSKNQGSSTAGIDLELATEFLLIAATLVELKTRRLLPDRNDGDLDEELGIWEERDLLLARLLECQTFKSAAGVMRQMSLSASLSYPRIVGPDERFLSLAPDLLIGVKTEDIAVAAIRAMTPSAIKRVDLNHIAPITASVTDAMFELIDELPILGQASFRQLTGGLVDRIEVVVRFLAILELFKQGHIDIDQRERFGDITLTWTGTESESLVPLSGGSYDG
ncbi:MAG: segregation and condensation protein A [Candidatus Poriferisodalaceae bacterium]|nr:MAG: segregation/condensation protein A [Acidimicrobiales bacterium MED-G01]